MNERGMRVPGDSPIADSIQFDARFRGRSRSFANRVTRADGVDPGRVALACGAGRSRSYGHQAQGRNRLKLMAALLLCTIPSMAGAATLADYVLVDKSEHTLTAMADGKPIAVFKAGFGVSPAPKESDGCISMDNSDMKELWEMVRVPVPIEIRP